MLSQRMRAAYDVLASDFARRKSVMPPEVAALGERFLQLIGGQARVLDLGCGAGRDLAWFEAHGEWAVGADLSAGMLAQARTQAASPLSQADMLHLPFANANFGGVWCNAALLHLPKAQAPLALSEIYRVLAYGGGLFLSIQAGSGEAWESSPHARGQIERLFARYERDEMLRLLARSGLVVLEIVRNQAAGRTWLLFLARRES